MRCPCSSPPPENPIMHRLMLSLGLLAIVSPLFAADPPADPAAAKRQPTDFAIVFNMGYAGDNLPKEKDEYEKLVKSLKAANFNVILGQYEPWRLEILKKYDMKLFVDLLVSDHHVYKNEAAAKKLCESLKGNETIYGYHIWSDNITKNIVAGRSRDCKNVHEWDPTHPVYVGTKTMAGISGVEGEDIFGYYDFHWKRGGHWSHLSKAANLARTKKLPFLRYDDATSGIVGKGNSNRVGYTYATSIPFGLKGFIYHYAGGIVDNKTWELDALGKDQQIVNGKLAAAGPEIMKIGAPIKVYSSTVSTSEKNDKLEGDPKIPGGLAAVPADHWFQIKQGEVLVGQFADAEKRDVLVFATHNPYASQTVTLTFPNGVKSAEAFNRKTKKWEDLKVTEKSVTFGVEEAAVDLVRFAR